MSYRAVLVFAIGCAGHAARMTDASSAVYVRSDTDATTIVAPTVRVAGAVDHATVAATYSVDAWTGASVDVITAATKAIHERRNEVDATVGYEAQPIKISANYRFSIEPDYMSHGLTLGMIAELAGKNTTVAFDVLGTDDRVGRSGDPGFSMPVRSLGGRLAIAQVIDRNTIAEVGWQTTLVDGYQASPYRFVAIGDLGTCVSNAPFCIPERVPNQRLRNAVTARGRRAFGRSLSAGLDYRFYFDDWNVRSHAIQPDLAWRLTDTQTLSVRYRYATQSEASFYRPRYFDVAMTNGLVTRDRKLSALFSNEVGLQYLHRLEADSGDRIIIWGVRSTLSRTDYLAYVGLDHVWAIELTALVSVELP
jgi:hypothetical protein